MLYTIHYFANKERRRKATEWLKKSGSASVPFGTLEVYFLDKTIAQELADNLTEVHLEEGLEYSVVALEKLKETDVSKKLIMHSTEDYSKFMDRKYKRKLRNINLGL